MTVIEPNRSLYGKVSDKALDELLRELTTMMPSAFCAVVVNQVDIKERQFRVRQTLGEPVDQIFQEIRSILDEEPRGSTTIQPSKTSVVWKGQPMEWVILSHSEKAPDIRTLSFGLRVDRVGEHMDFALYVLFAYKPPLNSDARDELGTLLQKKIEDLAGYGALEGMARDLVKHAAKRVDQKAGSTHGGPHKLKGPVPL